MAAAGTVATLAHGVVKWAMRFVSAAPPRRRDVDVDAEVMQGRELTISGWVALPRR